MSEHVGHCDALITCCRRDDQFWRLVIAVNEDVSPMQMLALAEALRHAAEDIRAVATMAISESN